MTTGATIAGHFPLILVTGAGAAARNSIGLVLVGGIAIGSLFTLFIIPSIYMLVARDHSKDRIREQIVARRQSDDTNRSENLDV
jgi:multidrug efflux pump